MIIHPDYRSLQEFIRTIPGRFDAEGHVIYAERNVLKMFHAENVSLVVKSFKTPHLINKIAYAFFRKSKACRSYEHGCKLLDLGISTPAPVAYIETFSGGLIDRSFYICLHLPDARNIRKYADGSSADTKTVMEEVACFSYRLHQVGVLHIDLSPGNILWQKDEKGDRSYALVDINRMIFKRISKYEALRNFERLCLSVEASTMLAKAYADCCSQNKEEIVEKINCFSDRFFEKRAIATAIKKLSKEKGIVYGLCGPVQFYLFLRKLRFILYKGLQTNRIFQKEKAIYDIYIKEGDLRQVLNRKYGYSKYSFAD